MAEPTLIQIFGDNAVQDANTLTISKADLASTGLIAASDNTAESLFVALLLKAASYLTETNQTNNVDQQITIAKGFDSLTTRNNQSYLVYPYSVELQKINTLTTVNPADF
jgi:hypothetical protein